MKYKVVFVSVPGGTVAAIFKRQGQQSATRDDAAESFADIQTEGGDSI
jgi:hypothetical protein